MSLCRAIRAEGVNAATPLLMVTARDAEADKVLGLESGADDYLATPFGMRELVARVRAITRRHQRAAGHARGAPGEIIAIMAGRGLRRPICAAGGS